MTWPINKSNNADALACDPGLPIMGVDTNNRFRFLQLDADGGIIATQGGTLVPQAWNASPVPPVGAVGAGVVLGVVNVFLNPATANRWLQFQTFTIQYLNGAAVPSANVLFFLSGTAFDTYASARAPWVDSWAPTPGDVVGLLGGVSLTLQQIGTTYTGTINPNQLDGFKGATASANIRAVIISTAAGATAGPGASSITSVNGHYYG